MFSSLVVSGNPTSKYDYCKSKIATETVVKRNTYLLIIIYITSLHDNSVDNLHMNTEVGIYTHKPVNKIISNKINHSA